ncbi:MAG: leucine-rich repeat domain-containing protein [Pseudanabaena sp. Salubria-1]|nr:leucine-rich repeat domain-containing protein [Pseudanabaena sp. Salubria-1]
MTDLALYANQISDVKPLKDLINLERLGLGNNQISDVKPLVTLTKLTALWLSGNPITEKICPVKLSTICLF